MFGFSYGGAVTCFPALVGDVFGRAHAGSIVGTLFAASGSLGAFGPFLAAWLFETSGSYRVAFLVSAASNVVALSAGRGAAPPPVDCACTVRRRVGWGDYAQSVR